MDTIFGNIKGLKSSHIKQLKRLYEQKMPSDRFGTPEFAQRLGAISTEIRQPVCAYINRRGQVIRVGVGSPRQTQIPPLELPRYGAERLSGIRCIATQLEPEPPKESCLTAMVLQRLDAMVTLPLTGEGNVSRGRGAAGFVDQAYLSYLLPQSDKADTDPNRLAYWDVSPLLSLPEVMGQDFVDLVEGLEAEFRREYIAQTVDESIDRVLIVGLITQTMDNYEFLDTLTELERLVDTAGGKVVETITQKRSRPDSKTVVGSGKVDDIALKVQTLGVNLVVFDRDLSPMQVRNIEQTCGVRVVDRTEVILDIF
ncbi:MAG: GTPase HflX, partial [Synechococcaceae cyanobacterium RL_1_2]|nr:GTPase HflX [Synechococcaceae cyanobacterium RL_1_2]